MLKYEDVCTLPGPELKMEGLLFSLPLILLYCTICLSAPKYNKIQFQKQNNNFATLRGCQVRGANAHHVT